MEATITGSHPSKSGKLYIDFMAGGIKGNLPAWLFSKSIQNNPEQAKMMDGCKVEKDGLYVSLIVSENREKITEIYKNGIK